MVSMPFWKVCHRDSMRQNEVHSNICGNKSHSGLRHPPIPSWLPQPHASLMNGQLSAFFLSLTPIQHLQAIRHLLEGKYNHLYVACICPKITSTDSAIDYGPAVAAGRKHPCAPLSWEGTHVSTEITYSRRLQDNYKAKQQHWQSRV